MLHRTRTARCLLAGVVLVLAGAAVEAGPNEKKSAKSPPPGPRASVLNSEAWTSVPVAPVSPADIDALISRELKATGITPAARTTDEQFLRRVTLDLIGELPLPADVTEFVDEISSLGKTKPENH